VVDLERLGNDRTDRHPWVERLERLLKDDLHLGPLGPQLLAVHRPEVLALEGHRAGVDVQQPEHGPAERRLAAPALADDRERLALVDMERDSPQGVDRIAASLPRREGLVDLVHLNE
jgi:hypothetical protein